MNLLSAAKTAASGANLYLLAAILVIGLAGGFWLGWQLPAAQRDAAKASQGSAESALAAGSAQWSATAEKLRADNLAALRARDAAVTAAIRDATAGLAQQVSEEVAPLKALSGPSWDCLRRPLSEDVLAPLRRPEDSP